MQNLPRAEVYEKEFKYMPWGVLINEVHEYICKQAPKNGKVLDLLCGPGYLVGKLQTLRPDLSYTAVDLEKEYIDHAKKLYPTISFIHADAISFNSNEVFDVVTVTAGLHHIPHEQQEAFIQKVSKLVKPEGFAIIGDPYIDDYNSEQERIIAGAKLGYEYLKETVRNGGDAEVIDAAITVMTNDVKLVEYKTSIQKISPIFKKYFREVDMHKTWPQEISEYGDYYFILRK